MRNLKIFVKIFLSHTFIGLFAVLILSVIFYNILSNSLIQRTIDQLSSINILKKNQVENYLSRTQKSLLFLFSGKEITHTYHAIMKEKGKRHEEDMAGFAREVSDIQKIYEFPEIAVTDSRLHQVYSTSADTSWWKGIFQKGMIDTSSFRQQIGVKMIDAPSLSMPGSTMLVYVLQIDGEGGEAPGYVFIKENFQKIQTILYERTGMGNTGESYLVGNDFFMRSSSRFYPDAAPRTIRVKTEAAENAFKGITGQNIILDYRGEKVLSVYRKMNHPHLKWAVISEMDYSEAIKPMHPLKQSIIFISIVLMVVILLITYFLSNAISRSILYLRDIINSLSMGIIPEKDVSLKSEDEIGQMSNAINQLVEGLRRTTGFAYEIGSGNFNVPFTTLSEKDTLGNALITMRDQLKELNEREIRLVREKAAALVEGQENERKRIGRDLHDGVGQLLTVIKLRTEMLPDSNPLKDELKGLINDAIIEIRRISYNVMPSALVDFGLEPALKGLCDDCKKYSGMTVDFKYFKETEDPLNFEISIAIFRIVQEALNNIMKYSKATLVTVYVVKNPSEIYVVLKDNGVGFDKEAIRGKRGFGLTSMKERARLLNGDLEIDSSPDKGTVLEVHIPIPEANTSDIKLRHEV